MDDSDDDIRYYNGNKDEVDEWKHACLLGKTKSKHAVGFHSSQLSINLTLFLSNPSSYKHKHIKKQPPNSPDTSSMQIDHILAEA